MASERSTPPPPAPFPDDPERHARRSARRPRDRRRDRHARHAFGLATLHAAVVIAVLTLVWLQLDPLFDGAVSAVEWLRGVESGIGRSALTVLLVAGVLLGYVAAWAHTVSPRRPVRLLDGRGTIPVDEIAGQLRAAVLERRDVTGAHVEVENRQRRGVWIAAEVRVAADARLTDVIEGVDRLAADLVEGSLGLRLADEPAVRLRYEELDLRSERVDEQRGAFGYRARGG